jgi:SAM-dependent methyltransferase
MSTHDTQASAPRRARRHSFAELIGDYDNPHSLGSRLRRRRSAWLTRLVDMTYGERGRCSILDLGGTETYWNIIDPAYLQARNCRITLLNVAARPPANVKLFDSRVGDATAVDVRDNAFDIVHSNSVIEHVGDWRRTLAFSLEVRRLAARYYVQTPNFWFPWEPHFGTPLFHFLPAPLRIALLRRRDLGHFERCALPQAVEAVESIRLLDKEMLRCLFPDAQIMREKFLGLTKSLIAIRE